MLSWVYLNVQRPLLVYYAWKASVGTSCPTPDFRIVADTDVGIIDQIV